MFHKNTAPVIGYYEELGLLRRIDAARPVEEVYAEAYELLTALV